MQPPLRFTHRQVDVLPRPRDGEASHLPHHQLSVWPLLLSAAISLLVVGLLFVPDNPWLALIALPLILVGIIGWALEDPAAESAPTHELIKAHESISIEKCETVNLPAVMAGQAQEGVDHRREAVSMTDTILLIAQETEVFSGDDQAVRQKNPNRIRLRPF
jgi:hypothetical protein